MPLSRPTFMNSSVLSINTSIGWGSNGSQMRIELVDDIVNGDSFSSGVVGGPVYFTLGSFSFNGILQKVSSNSSRGGNPIYEVTLGDPRNLLDNCKIISDNYRLSVAGILNLFNVFGYYENGGYGLSQSNETGMPWELIRDGLLAICNAAPSDWGGPISYRGFTYSLDLSALPALPSYFRVGGNLSILDFISICCEAANYDFFVRLVGTTITIHTVARGNAYPLGTIGTMLTTTFADSYTRSSDGLEERNEITSTFVVGGSVQSLYKGVSPNIHTFWGFYPLTGTETDINNLAPILGDIAGQEYANFYGQNNVIYTYPVKRYNIYIDSPTIATYTGLTYWETNDLELQVILGLGQHKNSFTTWARYLYITKYSLYQQIALTNDPPNLIQPRSDTPVIPNNTTNTNQNQIDRNQATRQGNLFISGNARMKAVYDFLRKYATEFYGRKYAIHLPGVTRKWDTDSGAISYSHEISDGGWVDVLDGNDLSGLPAEAYNQFTTQDGRFQSFCTFSASGVDISRVNKSNSFQAIDSNDLYVKTNVDRQIYFDDVGDGFAIADVDPVYSYPDSIVGLSGVVGPLYVATGIYIEATSGNITSEGQNALRNLLRFGGQNSVPLVVHPAPLPPIDFQIAYKSNILNYGPWYAQGASGKVNYIQDISLVPWNYGGYTNLDLAGNAKASENTSQAQVIETGYVEVVGYPTYNIGDVIETNGPNITNISVSFGKEGATTTYRFETYVPRPGQLGKYNLDLLRRSSIANTQLSKTLNQRGQLVGLGSEVRVAAELGRIEPFQANLPPAIQQNSPANMFVAQTVQVNSGPMSGHSFATVSIGKLDEIVGLIPSGGQFYNETAVASLESTFFPYSIFGNASGMPHLHAGPNSNGPNATTLNPLLDYSGGHIFKYYTKGEDRYVDLNDFNWDAYGRDGFVSGIPTSPSIPKRIIGFKAPLVLGGWGYKLDGARTGDYIYTISGVYPSGFLGSGIPETPWSSGFPDFDYSGYTDFTRFKVGPLDVLWDENRNVWTSHDILKGTVVSDIAAGSSGIVNVEAESGNFELYAFNNLDDTIAASSKTVLGYIATDNKWNILNVAAPSTPGGSSSLPSGIPFSLLWTNSGINTQWSTAPQIEGLILGGSLPTGYLPTGYLLNSGYLKFGNPDGSGFHTVQFDKTDTDIDWVLPANLPASGQTLYTNINGNKIAFSWHTIYDVPDPSDYSVFYNQTGVNRVWSNSPTLQQLNLGGAGNNELSATGVLRLGTPEGSGYFGLKAQSRDSDFDILFPYNTPATGQIFRVSSFNSTQADIIWDSITITSGTTTIGGNIQDVGTANAGGSSSLVAREDHVHKHPIFSSGDLHPEYNLPTKSAYTVLWNDAIPTTSFTNSPIINDITLGGSGYGFNTDGYVALGSPSGAGNLKIKAQQRDDVVNLYLPNNTASANDVLSVELANSSSIITQWKAPGSISAGPFTVINQSGYPSFNAAAGFPVFNLYDHDIYICDGSSGWWKFCYCSSGIVSGGGGGGSNSQTFDSNDTWVAAATSVVVECWGPGGDGHAGDGGLDGGGGGGGGAYASDTVTGLTIGNSYTVHVGASSGDDTYFINNTTVMAKSGSNGGAGTGGGGGDDVSSVGSTKHKGGDGGSGVAVTGGGGGGGSATSSANGGNGGNNGGSGGTGEGTGGYGGTGSVNGTAGNIPGGGGGGGGVTGSGAAGAHGRVKLAW